MDIYYKHVIKPGRQRQVDLGGGGQPGLYNEFRAELLGETLSQANKRSKYETTTATKNRPQQTLKEERFKWLTEGKKVCFRLSI